jgi:hypothetical protein
MSLPGGPFCREAQSGGTMIDRVFILEDYGAGIGIYVIKILLFSPNLSRTILVVGSSLKKGKMNLKDA